MRVRLSALAGSLIARWTDARARRWVRKGSHHATGTRGERLAERHLRAKGLHVLARNARTPAGEADLLLEDRRTRMIVLAEVKSRTIAGEAWSDGPSGMLAGERAVNADKRRRLLAIAEHLRRSNAWHDRAIRIDIVVVEISGSEARIRHLPDAVRG